MSCFRPAVAAVILFCPCALSVGQLPPDPLPAAEAVMARVATNQDQAEAERGRYVYVQHAKMVSRHGGTVMCEEITDYRMTPSSEGSHEELLNLDGRQRKNHDYLTYHALPPDQAKTKTEDTPKKDQDPATIPVTISDDSIDRDIVQNMRWNLIHDKSKDGISAHLFPLTSKDQQDYVFHMVGRERMNDRDVFHIAFLPKKKDDFGWSGDAFIDTTAFQPVLVTTGMARKLPFAVRTLLGTNLPGLGFTVTYAPQPDGVWFPVTFSTEFKIHVLFFFNREVILDAQNREFEKTHVTSQIVGEATPVEEKPESPQ
ncbi:MAG TPA: hypothetical protein VFD98_17140 [Terracidiphilus sp.]|nr:hypothetical protein [Terracidiphilus sp.]